MANKKITWKSETRKVAELKPFPGNPRRASEKQAQDLDISLERFNVAEPLVINTDNTVIGGNFRTSRLKAKGITQVDVRVPSRALNEKEASELNLRLNKNTAEFDFDLLANFDQDLLKDVGFDSLELDNIFQPESTPEDDVVPEAPAVPVTKTGDLYQLGAHYLLCGDCTKKEDVDRLMAGKKADMVFTDPPYGICLETDFTDMVGKFGRGSKYEKIIGDNKDFDPSFIFDQFEYCKEIFLWGGDYYLKRLPEDGSLFVWDKRCGDQFGKMYGSCFELCWGRAKHKREIIRHIWAGVFGTEKEDIRKRIHPTQKPVGVCEWFINRFSQRDNLIVDLFLGSGSTLIACEKTGRICYGMEIDQIYCDVIVKRWEQFTGKKAKRL